jgi:L-alanine-DL-glutamate epimerase-like enolase superfamily enzyme
MKLTRVEALSLHAPFERPFRTGYHTFESGRTCVVRLTTDTGLEGIGECLARYSPRVWAELVEEVLGPLIINEDPTEVEWLWERMYRGLGSLSGHSRGILLEAISGIDIAIWDILGKDAGKPIHQLLGGFNRRRIEAYASSVGVDSLENMVADATSVAGRGFTAIKIKIGLGVRRDTEIVTAIRQAVGDDIDLMVDANCKYRYADAARLARRLEELNVAWFEEPVTTEDRNSFAKLRQNSIIPLAAGEGEFTRYGAWELLDTKAIDVIQPDVARAGGITETRKIAIIASLYNAAYSPHVGNCGAVCAAASVHLAASVPNFSTYECSYYPHPLRDELVLEPVGHASQVENGTLPVPTRPGLGIELNYEVVERFLIRA